MTNIVWCIAYKRGVGRRVVYCPIVVQLYCSRVGNAGGRGGKDGWFVHNNLDVNEYLVKAKLPPRVNPSSSHCLRSHPPSSPYVGNLRSEETNPESRFSFAHFMNPCTWVQSIPRRHQWRSPNESRIHWIQGGGNGYRIRDCPPAFFTRQ